jgi:hypothetical protein
VVSTFGIGDHLSGQSEVQNLERLREIAGRLDTAFDCFVPRRNDKRVS